MQMDLCQDCQRGKVSGRRIYNDAKTQNIRQWKGK